MDKVLTYFVSQEIYSNATSSFVRSFTRSRLHSACHKGKLPMIDAYMIVLARNLGAVLVTSDESVAKTSEARVEYTKPRG